MWIWILLLLLAFGNGQVTQESPEYTSRPPPRNRYDERDQNTGFGFWNPQNENVVIKEA